MTTKISKVRDHSLQIPFSLTRIFDAVQNTGQYRFISLEDLFRHRDVSDGTDLWKHIEMVHQAGADAMIKPSVEAGVNFIDTANVYAFGRAGTTLEDAHGLN
jgi:hypothetical protein